MLKMFKKNKGFTLMELTVAVALFAVTIISATSVFRLVAEGQRNAIAAQNIQGSMRYALEVVSKEMRMAAKAGSSECGGASGKVYFTGGSGDNLIFKNYKGECVEYKLDSNRFQIDRDEAAAYITPDEIKVSNLKFTVKDDVGALQSMVTMSMDVEMAAGSDMHKQMMKIQTTISSRYYGG